MKASRRPTLVAVLAALALAACGEPDPTPSAPDGTAAATASPASTSTAPAASETAAPSASDAAGAGPASDEPPSLALEEVATGLRSPINVAATPDGWLFVNERAGRVVAVDPATGETAVALDLTDRVGSGGSEQGLLGLAFHPDWPDEPRAFVHYTDRDGHTVLSELRAADDGPPARLDPAAERVLLTVEQPYQNHNGGQLAFGPDGYLYVALGDGGSGGDPHGHGQDASTLLGSILRIDVEPPDDMPDSMPYGIPEDNPFADGADGAPEIFLTGLRNPWRFSFDREGGALWIADVGQNAVEEVNRIDPPTEGGANLGWNVMEASHCFDGGGCETDGLVLPVAEYGHDRGCSVTGGHVYRGEAIADLRGWYLFSDYCSGLLFAVPSDADPVIAPRVVLETGAAVSAFGEGPDGELYLTDLEGGALYRIVSASR